MYFAYYAHPFEGDPAPIKVLTEDDLDWHLDQLQYEPFPPTFFDNYIVFEAELAPPEAFDTAYLAVEIADALIYNDKAKPHVTLSPTIKTVLDQWFNK